MDFRQDTIVAKATASGAGAIGVIRISGIKCFEILTHLMRGSLPQSHEIKVRKFYANEQLVDEGMLAVFPGPNSFSGEDMAELYIHGSDFIASRLLQACIDCGCRLADPGEFTLRAYLNGKLDLAQAEAVADLIAAQSDGAHKLALNQLRGGVSEKIAGLRAQILEFAALIELELDFGEEDVEFASRIELRSKLEKLDAEISALLSTFKSGNAIKDGVPVAIVGKPNAGKSTLLNALLKEERAIVTDIPGTTRDTIEEYFFLEGIKFRLIDTAGIRKSNDVVEALGIQRTYDSISKAALVMLVADASADSVDGVNEMLEAIASSSPGDVWLVLNKTDVGTIPGIENAIGISAGSGNVGALIDRLSQFAKKLMSDAADTTISHLRHAEALTQAHTGIQKVMAAMDANQSGDILAFELRNAMSELGKITGEIDSQDILGEIFGKFCIGK